jgi:NhaP-type Na+/H+ or K+/H+ antiporter
MTAVFVFALTLLVAVLISELADRSVIDCGAVSVGGGLAGQGCLGVLSLPPDDPPIALLAELALFSILGSDGMRMGLEELTSTWHRVCNHAPLGS